MPKKRQKKENWRIRKSLRFLILYLVTIIGGIYIFLFRCFRAEFSILFSFLGVCGGGILMRREKSLKWGWFYMFLSLLVALIIVFER